MRRSRARSIGTYAALAMARAVQVLVGIALWLLFAGSLAMILLGVYHLVYELGG